MNKRIAYNICFEHSVNKTHGQNNTCQCQRIETYKNFSKEFVRLKYNYMLSATSRTLIPKFQIYWHTGNFQWCIIASDLMLKATECKLNSIDIHYFVNRTVFTSSFSLFPKNFGVRQLTSNVIGFFLSKVVAIVGSLSNGIAFFSIYILSEVMSEKGKIHYIPGNERIIIYERSRPDWFVHRYTNCSNTI